MEEGAVKVNGREIFAMIWMAVSAAGLVWAGVEIKTLQDELITVRSQSNQIRQSIVEVTRINDGQNTKINKHEDLINQLTSNLSSKIQAEMAQAIEPTIKSASMQIRKNIEQGTFGTLRAQAFEVLDENKVVRARLRTGGGLSLFDEEGKRGYTVQQNKTGSFGAYYLDQEEKARITVGLDSRDGTTGNFIRFFDAAGKTRAASGFNATIEMAVFEAHDKLGRARIQTGYDGSRDIAAFFVLDSYGNTRFAQGLAQNRTSFLELAHSQNSMAFQVHAQSAGYVKTFAHKSPGENLWSAVSVLSTIRGWFK